MVRVYVCDVMCAVCACSMICGYVKCVCDVYVHGICICMWCTCGGCVCVIWCVVHRAVCIQCKCSMLYTYMGGGEVCVW